MVMVVVVAVVVGVVMAVVMVMATGCMWRPVERDSSRGLRGRRGCLLW
jgi:hypothetical protein